jgi:tRNA(Ile)-lysidine synthase
MDLVARFGDCLATLSLPAGPALVAVSGGPDSVALLDLLIASRASHALELIVAHVDHGIHPDSARAAELVRALAGRYGLDFELARLALGADAGETVARRARYDALARIAERRGAGAVLTAHHADDQVETVTMRFLAGSGPAGIAGMAVRRGPVVRPLLSFRRDELARYVLDRALPTWSDPANTDPRHLRSWLRSDVLPRLRKRMPELDRRVLRAAEQARADRAAWDAALDALGLDPRVASGGISVAAHALGGYDSALAAALIQAAARRAGCVVGARRAESVARLLARGGSGRSLPLGVGWSAELVFDRLLIARSAAAEERPAIVAGSSGECRWGDWTLQWRTEPAPERQSRVAHSAWFDPGGLVLEVRAARPGDRMRPLAGRGGRPLVRCFQEAKVPRSRRTAWPVLAAGESIIWVPGVCRSEHRVPPAGAEALRIDAIHA